MNEYTKLVSYSKIIFQMTGLQGVCLFMDETIAGLKLRMSHLHCSQIVVGFLVLVLIPVTYYGLAQYKFNGSYSVYDEVSHMSYAWSASHGNLPARGDNLEKVILDNWPCSGQDRLTEKTCSNGSPLASFTVSQQYNYFHPPVYYFITGWLARIIVAIGGAQSFTTAARAVSIVWMVAGIIALYFSLRSWRIERLYCYATCALVPFIPVFLNPGTAVTNDAAGLLTGAAAIWVMSKILLQQRRFIIPAVLIAFISGYLKGTFVFQFLAIAVVLVLLGLWKTKEHERARAWELMASGVAIGFSSLISLYSFTFIQSHRGNQSAVSIVQGLNTDPVQGSPIGELLRSLMNWVSLATDDTLRQGMDTAPGYSAWVALLSIVIIGSVGFLFFQQNKSEAHNLLVYISAFALLVYPTIVNLREYLSSGQVFPNVGERYGISVLPLILCCWAVAAHNKNDKQSKALVVTVPLVGCIVSFTSLVLLPMYSIPG